MEYVVLLKGLLFVAALFDGIYLGVLVHEMGHALVALLGTRQSIVLQVGTDDRNVRFSVGRLTAFLGLAGFRYGATHYDRSRESVRVQRWVIAGGPIASLCVTVGLGLSLWRFEPWSWIWVALFAFFVANFRILIVSLWPIEHLSPDGSGAVWLSDGLDFWRVGRH